jgi:hypothetical protein
MWSPGMRSLRSFATGLSLLVVLGLTTVHAQKGPATGPERQTLDSKATTVRMLLGVGDPQGGDWGGKVAIDKGEVTGVEGWRFRGDDAVKEGNAWGARTRPSVKGAAAKKQALAKKKAAVLKAPGSNQPVGPTVPNGVLVTLKAPDDARLTVETRQGNFTVALADLAGGVTRRYLDGKVEAQVVPTAVTLYDGPDQEDFPSAAVDAKGDAWVAFVVHQARGPATLAPLRERPKAFPNHVPKGGGDQVRLFRYANGKAGDPLDITPEGGDVWRPAVAVDGTGSVVVVWSSFVDGNWDLYQRTYVPSKESLSEP